MESTSDLAAKTIRESSTEIIEPLLVHCDQQTAGRGQRGNTWQSTPESLTFTWCIRESSIPANARNLLSLAAAVAAIEAIDANANRRFQVKWPNDIVFGTKKIGGILIESIAARQPWVLIGIGLNVNQTSSNQLAVDPKAAFAPGSIREATGQDIDKQKLMHAIVDALFQIFFEDPDRDIVSAVSEVLAFKGKQIRFQNPDQTERTGKLIGVNETGHLVLDTGDRTDSYYSGSIVGLAGNHMDSSERDS